MELSTRLLSLAAIKPELVEKVAQMQKILSRAHERTKGEIENLLGLDTWEPGPNKDVAKEKILTCFLKGDANLDLENLNLTTLPSGIKHLQISTLNISCNHFIVLPELPLTLEKLSCSACWQLAALPSPLPATLTKLNCIGCRELTELPSPLPATLMKLKCSGCRGLTALPSPLPAALRVLDCFACWQLTALPSPLPAALTELDCSGCRGLQTRPTVPHGCILTDNGNTYGSGGVPLAAQSAALVRLEIPLGGGDTDPLWRTFLMNAVREMHQGEDFSLVVEGHKMWGNEAAGEIRIKQLEGELSLTFEFDPTTGVLASIKDEGGGDVSLNDLKEDANLWGEILNQFAGEVLKTRGIQVEGTTIKVHPKALKKYPEKVLEKLTPFVTNVRYLNNDFTAGSAMDVGGVSRQFVTDLCKAMFFGIGDKGPVLNVTEERMLDVKELEVENCRKFGKLLSFVLGSHYPLITGVYLNPKFYLLLKRASEGLEVNLLAVEVIKETLNPDELTKKALEWYQHPSDTLKEAALEVLTTCYGAELTADSTDEDIKRELTESLLEPQIKKAKAILEVLEGMTPAAKTALGGIPDEALSEKIQGVLVTAETLKAALQIEGVLFDAADQKRKWILERIDEKAGDLKWLSSFVNFITGQPFLPTHSPSEKPIKLKFFDLPAFNAHTCFNMLDIPTNIPSRDEFLAALDVCMQDPKSFTTA